MSEVKTRAQRMLELKTVYTNNAMKLGDMSVMGAQINRKIKELYGEFNKLEDAQAVLIKEQMELQAQFASVSAEPEEKSNDAPAQS